MQHRHQNRWAGFSLSCAHYAKSMVLLDLSSARRKQREDLVSAKELAGLRGLLGQLMWLATQGVPQIQAPLSLLLGYLGVATVSTLLEANKLARRALVWAQTPLRTFVHEEMSVLVGQMPVGHVDEKDRLMEDTSLEWPTRHSWKKRKVVSV